MTRRISVGNDWQYDARVGAVAVYNGSKRDSLDGIQDDPACVFYKRGVWSPVWKPHTHGDELLPAKPPGSIWVVRKEDVEHAQLIARLLNSLERIASGECERNHAPESCNCASIIATTALMESWTTEEH